MSLKPGPYPTAKDARIALSAAGYIDTYHGARPAKWKHPNKSFEFAIRILNSGLAKIVKYPDLRRLDYRVTSDAERASQGFRSSLSRPPRRRPRD
jgi:hypothetical protein